VGVRVGVQTGVRPWGVVAERPVAWGLEIVAHAHAPCGDRIPRR
jgi:hypothetical protein